MIQIDASRNLPYTVSQSCAPIVANYFINLNLKFQRTLRASLDLPGDKKYDDI